MATTAIVVSNGSPTPYPTSDADADDDDDVHAVKAVGEQPVDDRSVDDDVDVVQPVLQDRDRDRRRNAEQRGDLCPDERHVGHRRVVAPTREQGAERDRLRDEASAATNATHLICWRSSGPADR